MINFDRAAPFYDDTRSLPADAQAAFLDTVVTALGDAHDVLEIGIGTGRVAVPLSERGFAIRGIDVSASMLEMLRAKNSSVRAQVGDATALPFDDDAVDAVLAVHVFHLIEDWRTAVAEAIRVVRPGGRIVLSGIDSDDPLSSWRARLYDEVGTTLTNPGAEIRQIVEVLEERGATIEQMEPVPYRLPITLGDELDQFAEGIWSRDWQLDDDSRRAAAATVRSEAIAEGTDLSEVHENKRACQVTVATLPS